MLAAELDPAYVDLAVMPWQRFTQKPMMLLGTDVTFDAMPSPEMPNDRTPPETKPVDKGGRPPHVPSELTRNVVRKCIGFGIPQDEICLALNMAKGTLRKHYKREIKAGSAQTQVQLVSNLLAMFKSEKRYRTEGYHIRPYSTIRPGHPTQGSRQLKWNQRKTRKASTELT